MRLADPPRWGTLHGAAHRRPARRCAPQARHRRARRPRRAGFGARARPRTVQEVASGAQPASGWQRPLQSIVLQGEIVDRRAWLREQASVTIRDCNDAVPQSPPSAAPGGSPAARRQVSSRPVLAGVLSCQALRSSGHRRRAPAVRCMLSLAIGAEVAEDDLLTLPGSGPLSRRAVARIPSASPLVRTRPRRLAHPVRGAAPRPARLPRARASAPRVVCWEAVGITRNAAIEADRRLCGAHVHRSHRRERPPARGGAAAVRFECSTRSSRGEPTCSRAWVSLNQHVLLGAVQPVLVLV